MKVINLDLFQLHTNTGNTGFTVKPEIQGLETPKIRLPVINLPAADGAIAQANYYGSRLITLEGRVRGSTASEYSDRRLQIEAATAINRVNGVFVPRTLSFTTMNDLNLQLDCYVQNFVFPEKDLLFGDYKLDLLATDYRILSQLEKTASIYIFSGGGMAVPMAVPMDMSAGGDVLASLVNAGNSQAFPKITLYGPIVNPVINNLTNGLQMTLTYTLLTGERIEIDTKTGIVLFYSSPTATPGVNKRQYISGNFITLDPGLNAVKLVTSSYNTTAFALLKWRDTYTGK